METKKSLIDMIHKHIKFEENTAKTCADLREKVDSAAAKMLLTEMQLDTTKHAHIFRELLDTLEKAPQRACGTIE